MRRSMAAVLPLVVFLATCVTFWPALEAGFHWDDEVNLVSNLEYRGFDGLRLRWMFTTTLMGHYMPVTWLSFALSHAVGGMSAWWYHVVGLLVHGVNAVLVYLVARRLLIAVLGPTTDARPGAAFAALLFAVHPQRVESVAWLSDRATLMCGAFYLLAVLAYLRGAEARDERARAGWLAASLAAFAAALMAKGLAMSLPLTLLILDTYPLRRWRGGWARVVAEKMPYGALASVAAVVAVMARGQGAEFTGYAAYGLAARAGLFAYSLCFYPLKLVWPSDLSPLYEVPRQVSLLEPRFLGAALGLLFITGLLFALRRRWPGALAAWTHSAVVVAPVSGAVHSGLQMVADRYSYLAQLGFVVLAGYGLMRLLALSAAGRVRPRMATLTGTGLVVVVGALASLAWSQSHVWRDPETLWRWAVDRDPLCAQCHGNLGVALLRHRADAAGLTESEAHLRRAVALNPGHAPTYLNLGTAALLRRRYPEAESALRDHLRGKPDSREGAERLAVLYLLQGRSEEAIPLLRRARTHAPDARTDLAAAVALLDDGETLRFLGQAFLEAGRPIEAIVPLSRAVELQPSAPSYRVWLAHAYQAAGQIAAAETERATLRSLDAPRPPSPGSR